ncbi:Uncharacterised protein [uncultured archaeon]|nr:Uncharacterised protein [uncultured archaeon]
MARTRQAGGRGARFARGQAYSLELLIAVSVFALILVFIGLAWSDIEIRRADMRNSQEMDFAARNTAWQLTQETGSPANWDMREFNETFPYGIGLADSPGELDRRKLQNLSFFNASNYEELKSRMGLGKYDFYLQVRNLADNETLYSAGIAAPAEAESSVFENFAALDGNVVIVRLEAWK